MKELPETVSATPRGRHSTDLLSAVEAERDRRWATGDRAPVEEYLQAHPSLSDGEGIVRLVYGEFLLRESDGEAPSIEEYQRRFPALAERLAQQIVLHRAVAGGQSEETSDQTKISGGPPRIEVTVQAAPQLADFEILEELGRGGMAVVYRARDRRLNRVVALKLIKSGTFPGEEEVRRFRAEAESVAKLRHPHIIQIFEVGEADGTPYMALEFVPGGTLGQKLRESPLSVRAAAELTEKLARALDAAHGAGVVHRDLKPGNILLAADGSPRVADFGLAKQLDSVEEHTRTGALLGTPSYMAPEQASGNTKSVGPPADVYALGAILYECLTGRPPFKASTVIETVTQVCSHDPVPPSRLTPQLPPDLEAVCLKCLEKSPARRYASAAALADDLRRWLDGKPTLARPVGPLARGWKLVRRNPVIATATAVSLLAIIVGTAFAWQSQLDTQRAQFDTQIAELAAERAKQELAAALLANELQAAQRRAEKLSQDAAQLAAQRVNNYGLLLRSSDRYWSQNALTLAEKELDDCPEELRRGEWHFRRHRNNPAGIAFAGDFELELLGSAVSADGKLLVTGSGEPHLPDRAGHVAVWSAATGSRAFWLADRFSACVAVGGAGAAGLPLTRHTGPVSSVAFQPNGTALVTASRKTDLEGIRRQDFRAHSALGGELIVWDVPSRDFRRVIPGAAGPVAFSANGTRFVACAQRRIARVWDVRGDEWKELPQLPEYAGLIGAVALSPDGRWLAVAGYHMTPLVPGSPPSGDFGIYDLTTGKKKPDSPEFNKLVTSVAFTPDGQTLVAGCLDGVVRQWDVATGRPGITLRGHISAVNGLAFGPGGKWLATAGQDQTVKLWDWVEGEELRTFRGHTRPVNSVAFAKSGEKDQIVSAGADGLVRFWDPSRDPATLDLGGHGGMPICVVFSPDRPLLASVSRTDWSVRVWNADTGQPVTSIARMGIEKIAFGPNGLLAMAGGLKLDVPGQLLLWEVGATKPKFELEGHKKFVYAVVFSPDGKRLASSAGDPDRDEPDDVKVWDVATGKELFSFRPSVGVVTALAFSPDGKRLAAGGMKNAVAVCDPDTGHELWRREDLPNAVMAVAFSPPNGEELATGDLGGFLTLHEAGTGRQRLQLKAHLASMTALAYDHTGTRIASTSLSVTELGVGEVRLWDVHDGREVLELPGEAAVAFSADGTKLAAPVRGSILGLKPSRAIRVWDFSPSALEATLRPTGRIITNVASDPAGRLLAAADPTGTVTIWDRESRMIFRTIPVSEKPVAGLDFSPDGKLLVTGSSDGAIHVWEVASGKHVRTINGHPGWVSRVKFDATGTRLISGGHDKVVRAWDVATGNKLYEFDHSAVDLTLSPDGRWAAACGGQSVKVFDPATGRDVKQISSKASSISVAFAPGLMAVGESEGVIRLRDTNTWSEVGQFTGHTGPVWGVAFGPRGVLYSVGADRTVRVWNVESRKQTAVFTEHLELVRVVVTRGNWLATGGYDGAVRIWNPRRTSRGE